MKLLFDENLSPRLVAALNDLFPGSAHVDRLGMGGDPDSVVWDYAKLHGYILVSKDCDFHERSLLCGHPPKVVWIRRGNCSVRQIELILRNKVLEIERLNADDELTYLNTVVAAKQLTPPAAPIPANDPRPARAGWHRGEIPLPLQT